MRKLFSSGKISGFTFIEMLILVAVLALFISFALVPNLLGNVAKARDSQRKQDLNKLSKILEDYYNDKQHYPPSDYPTGTIKDAPWGSPLTPYLSALPKDPFSPNQEYYYVSDPGGGNFYAFFTKLENTNDPDIENVGCSRGCGPGWEYNYVVHSPNVVMFDEHVSDLLAAYSRGGEGGPPAGGSPPAGGGGEPTSTPVPTATSTPTPLVPTPTVTPPLGATCGNNQCCWGGWCGGAQGSGGIQCGPLQKCFYDIYSGIWDCVCSSLCGAFWCDP